MQVYAHMLLRDGRTDRLTLAQRGLTTTAADISTAADNTTTTATTAAATIAAVTATTATGRGSWGEPGCASDSTPAQPTVELYV